MKEAESRTAFGSIVKWRPGKNLSVFIICLIIALTFWFLNAFTKSYHTTVSFPVKYINLPDNQVLVSELPSVVQFEVTGFGFSLLTRQLRSNTDSLELDYDAATVLRKGDRSVRSISGQSLIELANSELPDDIIINRIIGDTIRMVLEKSEERILFVSLDRSITLADQFFINGKIKIEPASVVVKGPPSFLDELDSIKTLPLSANAQDKSINKELDLVFPQGISSESKKVNVYIPIDRKTQGEIKVPVQIEGEIGDRTLVLFPPEVTVTYITGLRDYEGIQANQFVFEVNTNEIASDKTYLIIKQRQVPSNVSIVAYDPHKVEYILKK
ncbi:MAG: hypothetical protein KDC83_08155 [Flavobacteriales bacterium]|nr:hypothetical protein [Flavobacteriales bacterium]